MPSDWALQRLANKIATLRSKMHRTNPPDNDQVPILTKGIVFYVQFGERSKVAAERSASRGRPVYQSTGRGGIGNIRQPSSDARPESGPDDFSVTRGRELAASNSKERVFSTGRGGVGNLRSPSRDVPTRNGDEDVIKQYKHSQEDAPFSTGRGGMGNMARSRSRDPASKSLIPPSVNGGLGNPRSRSRDPVYDSIVHTPGRGGLGNHLAAESFVESIDEDPRAASLEESYFPGRGGNANIAPATEALIEHPAHINDGSQSTGHGGVGNLVNETPD